MLVGRALSHVREVWTESSQCPRGSGQRKKFGLVGYQVKLCKRNPDLMPLLMRAARETRDVCAAAFAERRWNCSTLQAAPHLAADLTKGTREQAYVYSLSAAAVAYGVAKACAKGVIPWCPCGSLPKTHPVDFRWKGCSDNVDYGVKVSQEWADAPWKNKKNRKNRKQIIRPGGRRSRPRNNPIRPGAQILADTAVAPRNQVSMKTFKAVAANAGHDDLTPRLMMNQHNNDVGRKLVDTRRMTKCKCHGVSSSCTVKTCWQVLPDLKRIGLALKDKYVHATEVRSPNNRHRLSVPTEAAKAQRKAEFETVGLAGRVTHSDLVYIRKSPDYCSEDRRVGSPGTKGRQCNATAASHGSCDSMCCGRGYLTHVQEQVENCECKYVHCCYVKCKQCTTTIHKHYCK